ncbi:MAG: hypothetical protein ACYDHN_15835, partial [Solirubrobacteraceae bacterium]
MASLLAAALLSGQAAGVAAAETRIVKEGAWGEFFTVPAGVVSIDVSAVGGAGGSSCGTGGLGAIVHA